MEQQKPLFSVIPGLIEEKRFLNVLLNGASARMKFRDLFVPSQTGFDSIKLATYVASPSYLNKLTSPPGIVKTPGAVLVLYKERFLSFIGEKEGFAKRLARIFRS